MVVQIYISIICHNTFFLDIINDILYYTLSCLFVIFCFVFERKSYMREVDPHSAVLRGGADSGFAGGGCEEK